jgi:ATP-dependent helicase YprA (DUF1998 family)
MDVFELRRRLVDDYERYIRSFISIRDQRIRNEVDANLRGGLLWPDPRIGLNPSFEPGGRIDDLVDDGRLHPECSKIFRLKPDDAAERALRLHRHQVEAIDAARTGDNYVLTTGTGSGKSLAYIIPIVDHVLRNGSRKGIKAIVVYPMNALANSQFGELEKFLVRGYGAGNQPVTFRRYTGQESDEDRNEIIAAPPDILLTNYVMLELILTRVDERALVKAAEGLRFLVFDELHTYRGRQGADVALLARRVREACHANRLQIVGTSATMTTGGTFADQQEEVARVASTLFGSNVKPQSVIGETLQRATRAIDLESDDDVANLTERVKAGASTTTQLEMFNNDPLSRWIEATFGVTEESSSGRLVRATPRAVTGEGGAAHDLAELTGVPVADCARLIEHHLLAGNAVTSASGFPVFAFRLHQFISRGTTVFSSIEPEDERYLTLHPQTFVPDHRDKVLIPLVFCRECGQEYYSVVIPEEDPLTLVPKPIDFRDEVRGEPALLYLSTTQPWPDDLAGVVQRVPETWVEETKSGALRIKYDNRKRLPQPVTVSTQGELNAGGHRAWIIHGTFQFCLSCGVAYGSRQRSEALKLSTLGAGGRSTATTVLSLAAVRYLRHDEALSPEARKLLSFTDNRQDASLQAGHFNDFVETGLLRSALYRAVDKAGDDGLSHDELTQEVFDALALPERLYAFNPELRGRAAQETAKALRDVLGYRLYLDQRRGWRITSPNLEQTGLLSIGYPSLADAASDDEIWKGRHGALAIATPEQREQIGKTLLDHLRRELAIKVDYLNATSLERVQQSSSQWLKQPWALDEDERLVTAFTCYPRSKSGNDDFTALYLSGRSGFGQYLRRPSTLPLWPQKLTVVETDDIIADLLEALTNYGLVSRVRDASGDRPAGYQLNAAEMSWMAGDGTPSHDPVRVPRPPEGGLRPNEFFVDFYRTVAADGQGLEAREHTAQVPYPQREDRERRFKVAELPVLYCSPTMELGVDIADLNVVNLRNVPPTPANYAQRSGRAGRSGQPALVFTYCTTGSSHDQFFFRRQERMVAGVVSPPRLDLANEDLVRAHVHAIWLAEVDLSLGSSLTHVLDVNGDQPSLELLPHIRDGIDRSTPRDRARARAAAVLSDLGDELQGSGWWHDDWLDDAMRTVANRFDASTTRWRDLYRSALSQSQLQTRIVNDASRNARDREQAKRLRREAEAQAELLRSESTKLFQSDFYSYRYFAAEGFLPGYSFPRLPLSAFIPARRGMRDNDEFLSRPRFLAISEFGPRNFVYHEGSRYQINRVILPVADMHTGGDDTERVLTRSAKICPQCGYLHPISGDALIDVCDSCGSGLGESLQSLFRLQNVVTRRRDRISSDEEERQRQGYDLHTAVRFAGEGPTIGVAQAADGDVAWLSYGHSATIWRINLGWRRRKVTDPPGFILDLERGYWARRQDDPNEADGERDPMSPRTERVIPYVDDTRNALVVQPTGLRGDAEERRRVLASLEAALKSAMQVVFQLEDNELAAHALPSASDRRQILVYEAAEGGAGVLRRLVEEPGVLAEVARAALEVCHFDPATGDDLGAPPHVKERCEAACYDCLLSYSNQPDHRVVDRFAVRDLLLDWAGATVEATAGAEPRAAVLERLMRLAGSDLERRWLEFLDVGGHHLPSRAQVLIRDAESRPDFLYEDDFLAVYVDGPPHDYPERQERDEHQQQLLERLGWTVVRLRYDDDWRDIVERRPDVFGEGTQ